MDHANKNPAALAGANRVDSQALSQALSQGFDRNPTETAPESLAVRMVAQRYRISIFHARTICQLSGIGGQA